MGHLFDFFASADLTPHGFCLLWRPELIGLHVVSDAVTGLSYYSIPVALIAFVRRRQDLEFSWIFWMFGAFILACGTTHWFEIWTIWHPDYGSEGLIKAATALLSVTTAALLWPLVPKLLAIPSPAQLREANARLLSEVRERIAAEAASTALNGELEARVVARTAELTQLNDALRKSEERFRRVVESTPNAMVMIDAGGRIEMVNAEAERVFGYARAELLGEPIELLVPERARGHHPGLRETFFAGPVPRAMGAGRDLHGLRKDGSEFPVEICLNPIETDEGTMVLSTIVDISDRKQKEARIEAALKEKDILLGEIHHRVKNNLQIVHSLLDLQSGSIQDTEIQEMLRESQNRIRSMALIHQTLYESKDFARVDFRNFLDTLVPTLASSYGADPNHIVLSINAIEVRLPLNVAIPCGLMVNELISNALKHAYPGNRHGEIRIDLTTESNDQVLLSVEDDGVGIPDDLDLDQTDTLGLQLVMLLTDQIGGEMVVRRSNPTRFALRIHLGAEDRV